MKTLKQDQPSIVIIGRGVVGLTIALHLLQHGYQHVAIIAEGGAARTCSIGAGALWRQTLPPTDPQYALFESLAAPTYHFLFDVCQKYEPITSGVQIVHGFECHQSPITQVPLFALDVLHFQSLSTPEQIEAHHLPSRIKHALSFSSFVIDMALYLDFLAQLVIEHGGRFIEATLESFASPFSSNAEARLFMEQASLVVNATGLGSLNLLNDRHCYPVRGCVVRVEATNIKSWVCDIDRGAYIFPRVSDVVLGGTYDKNATDTSTNEATVADIISRCSNLYPQLQDANVVNVWCGLRPYREKLRLEAELPACSSKSPVIIPSPIMYTLQIKTKPLLDPSVEPAHCQVPVLHAYGTGGSGVTLSVGIAKEVLALCEHHQIKYKSYA